jgi:carboxyl-terminal processing protease
MNHFRRRLNDLLRSFALALVLPAWFAVGQEATSSAFSPKDAETAYKAQQEARWSDAALVTPYAINISDADKIAGLSLLWAQAKFGFANFWHVPRLNWDLTYREFIPKVLATRSTAEYYRVLQSFYALLEDGHTNVYPPDDVNITPMPLKTRLVDGRLLVLGAARPGFSLQGMQSGDEIVTIDGESATDWAQKHVEPFVSASTPQDRVNRTFGPDLFSAPKGTTFHLTTSTPSGAHADLSLTIPPYVAAQRLKFQFQMLPGNIAYVQLNDFEDDTDQKQWDEHWPEISKSSALILDLRENGGGSESVGDHIMATLIDKPVPGERSRSTQWIATYRAWERDQTSVDFPVPTVAPDPERSFAGPVALLISPRTFSAAEDMTVLFAQAHRGPMIGEPTGGSTGQPLFVKLPGGGAARLCTKHDSFADGSEFVGVGIQPNIVVHATRADIIAKRDPVLEKAIETLQVKR